MRHYRIVMLLLCFLIVEPKLYGEPAKKTPSPEDFIKAWAAAFNNNKPEELIEWYDRSEKTELLVSTGKTFRGPKGIAFAYETDKDAVRFYDSEALRIRTRTLGETALASFEHKVKLRILADDQRYQIHVRTTSVLHRVEGEWKIVLEHSSPIEGIERLKRLVD